MRQLLLPLAGAALVLLACDPTQKHDFHCTATFSSESLSACSQFHITDAEGLVADPICHDKGGSWGSGACPSDLGGHAMIAGWCVVSSSGYSISGTDVSVFFYDPVTADVAEPACTTNGGTWHP